MKEIKCPQCGALMAPEEPYCIFCGATNPNKAFLEDEANNYTPKDEKSIYGANLGLLGQSAKNEADSIEKIEVLVPKDASDQEENVVAFSQKLEKKAAILRVEEEKRELEYLVEHDALTGAFNMAAFERHMKDVSKEKLCIIAIECTSYDRILEKMGQTPLEQTVIALTEAIFECFGKENVYREGDRTYLIAQEGYKEAFLKQKLEELGNILQRKNESLHKENKIDSTINIDANAGFSVGDGIKSLTELLDEAKRMRSLKTRSGLYGMKEGTDVYNANFDGYYDDVKAKEIEAYEAGLSKETIIRVVFLILGLTVAVILFELSL